MLVEIIHIFLFCHNKLLRGKKRGAGPIVLILVHFNEMRMNFYSKNGGNKQTVLSEDRSITILKIVKTQYN